MKDLQVVVVGDAASGKNTITRKLQEELSCEHSDPSRKTGEVADNRCSLGVPCACSGNFSHCDCRTESISAPPVRLRTAHRAYSLMIVSNQRTFLKALITDLEADAILLVLDASKGPTDLAYRYAYLAAMFGVKETIVAVNKMDLKNYARDDFEKLSGKMRAFLKRLKMNVTAVIPISAKDGENMVTGSEKMKWSLSPALMKSLDYIAIARSPASLPLRVLVKCSYVAGGRTKVLAKVASGKVSTNDELTFGPIGHTSRVCLVEVLSQERQLAESGDTVVLTLESRAAIKRGQVGFSIGFPPFVSEYLVGQTFWMGNKPLKVGDQVNILCGTACCSARIDSISEVVNPVYSDVVCNTGDSLLTSHIGKLGIKLDAPVCVDPVGRGTKLGKLGIIDNHTIVGGGILE